MRDRTNQYSSRDWGLTIGALGILLVTMVMTFCALMVMAASIYCLITEGHLGYILMALVALGFGGIGASACKWAFDSMVEA